MGDAQVAAVYGRFADDVEKPRRNRGRGGWHGPLYYSSTIVPPSGREKATTPVRGRVL